MKDFLLSDWTIIILQIGWRVDPGWTRPSLHFSTRWYLFQKMVATW